jgi:SPP1 family predicted phage head-tail adaptor
MAKCSCDDVPQPNRRIVIQKLKTAATVDGHGEINRTLAANWETFATVWASFQSLNGGERFASDYTQSGQTHRVFVRWSSTTKQISPLMRISYDSRILGILAAVDIDEQHRWMRLDVSEDK